MIVFATEIVLFLKTYFLRCRAAWPLAAVCCLGIILFLICAAIVLALIPLYLPTKDLTPLVDDNKCMKDCVLKRESKSVSTSFLATDPFYVQFSGDDGTGSAMPGTVGNLAEVYIETIEDYVS